MSYKKSGLKDFWRKKIVNVIIPFYVVSLAGYSINNFRSISWDGIWHILSFQSQWYINYLLICYGIFFVGTKLFKDGNKRMIAFVVSFIIWFFVDTLFFASTDAPFLRARQMGAFVSGIFIANKRERSDEIISKKSFCAMNFALGLVLMVVTNLGKVKEMPVIIGNVLSIGTVVPLAYAMISISLFWKKLCINSAIFYAGVISYELFLVHSYSLRLASSELWLLFVFVVSTIGLSEILNKTFKRLKKKLIS